MRLSASNEWGSFAKALHVGFKYFFFFFLTLQFLLQVMGRGVPETRSVYGRYLVCVCEHMMETKF